ncbi:unnamed protein product [Caenorhabditis auriculariae]|uniref:Uncharacterized protein n=1 Tax=Caenorhabditis auriculariae TaxID=2777116 RepID=A0A8S1HRA7_9PELO|nr:unnamed protein product [Caenorhabditis auriculariae]
MVFPDLFFWLKGSAVDSQDTSDDEVERTEEICEEEDSHNETNDAEKSVTLDLDENFTDGVEKLNTPEPRPDSPIPPEIGQETEKLNTPEPRPDSPVPPEVGQEKEEEDEPTMIEVVPLVEPKKAFDFGSDESYSESNNGSDIGQVFPVPDNAEAIAFLDFQEEVVFTDFSSDFQAPPASPIRPQFDYTPRVTRSASKMTPQKSSAKSSRDSVIVLGETPDKKFDDVASQGSDRYPIRKKNRPNYSDNFVTPPPPIKTPSRQRKTSRIPGVTSSTGPKRRRLEEAENYVNPVVLKEESITVKLSVSDVDVAQDRAELESD